MKLTRRNFLAWAGIAATGAIACDLFDDDLRIQSPVAIPEDLVTGRDNWYATHDSSVPGRTGSPGACDGRARQKVRGNPRFPTNQGKQSPRRRRHPAVVVSSRPHRRPHAEKRPARFRSVPPDLVGKMR